MKKMKRAVGYVCEIPVAGSDLVISKEDQRLRILKYAEKENIELVCIYEDDCAGGNCLNRPGVNKVLCCDEAYDLVLVERVWAMSRKMKDLEPVLDKLDLRKVPLVCTSYLWDCVSQQVRHRYSEDLAEKMREEAKDRAEARQEKAA